MNRGSHRLLVLVLATCVTAVAAGASAATPAPLWSRVEQSAARYEGSWPGASSDGASGGTYRRSRQAGAIATYTFTGTGVRVIGLRSNRSGIAIITVDGSRPLKVDTFLKRARHQRVLFEKGGLAPGEHTVRIRVTGTKNRLARSAFVNVDAFETTAADVLDPLLLVDDFEHFGPSEVWADGTRHLDWRARYDGFGTVGTAVTDTTVHRQRPKASTTAGETHASLVTTAQEFSNFTATARAKTVKQLRTPTPHAWEVAWIVWHYTHDEHFYYFAPKPNGWELGKVDNAKRNPDGPECVWPSYNNCVYPGAQRYLATGSTPRFPVGNWYEIEVRHVARTLSVSVDGTPITSFTDNERPYTSGTYGFYNEDAEVNFDDVRMVSALGVSVP